MKKDKINKFKLIKWKNKMVSATIGIGLVTTIGIGLPLVLVQQNKKNVDLEKTIYSDLSADKLISYDSSLGEDVPMVTGINSAALALLNTYITTLPARIKGSMNSETLAMTIIKKLINHATKSELPAILDTAKITIRTARKRDNSANLKIAKINALKIINKSLSIFIKSENLYKPIVIASGAIEPITEKEAYQSALDTAKITIHDATTVEAINMAKYSVSFARDIYITAIMDANAVALLKTDKKQKNRDIDTYVAKFPRKSGAVNTEASAIIAAKKLINQATRYSLISAFAKAQVIIHAAWENDNAANSGVVSLKGTKTNAFKIINRPLSIFIKDKGIYIPIVIAKGVVEPAAEKEAYQSALNTAKITIRDATTIKEINAAKYSVVFARDAYIAAIIKANAADALLKSNKEQKNRDIAAYIAKLSRKYGDVNTEADAIITAKQLINQATKDSLFSAFTKAQAIIHAAWENDNAANSGVVSLKGAKTNAFKIIDRPLSIFIKDKGIYMPIVIAKGAVEPAAEKEAYQSALNTAKITIRDATTIKEINAAKYSVSFVRDIYITAIVNANDATFLKADKEQSNKDIDAYIAKLSRESGDVNTEATAIIAAKKLINQATRYSLSRDFAKARIIIHDAWEDDNLVNLGVTGFKIVKINAFKFIDKPLSITIASGAIEPISEKEAYQSALVAARITIRDATTVEAINEAKHSVAFARGAYITAIVNADVDAASFEADKEQKNKEIDAYIAKLSRKSGGVNTEATAIIAAKRLISQATKDSLLAVFHTAQAMIHLAWVNDNGNTLLKTDKEQKNKEIDAYIAKLSRKSGIVNTEADAIITAKKLINQATKDSLFSVFTKAQAIIFSAWQNDNIENSGVVSLKVAKVNAFIIINRSLAIFSRNKGIYVPVVVAKGAIEPIAEKEAYQSALNTAKITIRDATTIKEINAAKYSVASAKGIYITAIMDANVVALLKIDKKQKNRDIDTYVTKFPRKSGAVNTEASAIIAAKKLINQATRYSLISAFAKAQEIIHAAWESDNLANSKVS